MNVPRKNAVHPSQGLFETKTERTAAYAADTAIISKFDAFIVVATRNENNKMHTATTTSCTVDVDWGPNTTSGTTRKTPVMSVVIKRPRKLEREAEFW